MEGSYLPNSEATFTIHPPGCSHLIHCDVQLLAPHAAPRIGDWVAIWMGLRADVPPGLAHHGGSCLRCVWSIPDADSGHELRPRYLVLTQTRHSNPGPGPNPGSALTRTWPKDWGMSALHTRATRAQARPHHPECPLEQAGRTRRGTESTTTVPCKPARGTHECARSPITDVLSSMPYAHPVTELLSSGLCKASVLW